MAALFTWFLVFAVVTLCTAKHLLPKHEKGQLVSGPSLTKVVTSANDQCAEHGKIGQFCSKNDCNTLLLCNANGGSFVQCSTLNAKNKYCSNNACTTTIPASCPAAGFTCNAVGYLPDPSNCAIYYYCPAIGGNAWKFDCKANYAFDIKISQCKKRLRPSDCAVMRCKAKFSEYMVYPADKSIYTFCNGVTGTSSVLRCEDALYQEFDVTTGKCKAVCKAAGNQVNRYNCVGYNYCYLSRGKWVMEGRTCPPGTWFNPTRKICAVGTCVNELPVPGVTTPATTSTTKSTATDPISTETSTSGPTSNQTSTTNATSTEPSSTEPVSTETSTAEPSSTEPPTTEPVSTESPTTTTTQISSLGPLVK